MRHNNPHKWHVLPYQSRDFSKMSDLPQVQFLSIWKDYYWRKTDSGLLFMGNGPMANKDLRIMNALREGSVNSPEHTIEYVPIVWATAIMSERFEHGEYAGLDWDYQELKELEQ